MSHYRRLKASGWFSDEKPIRTKTEEELFEEGFWLTPYGHLTDNKNRKVLRKVLGRKVCFRDNIYKFLDKDLTDSFIAEEDGWVIVDCFPN